MVSKFMVDEKTAIKVSEDTILWRIYRKNSNEWVGVSF